jgi:putative transposase
MQRRHELTDAQWEAIAPHLPGKDGDSGRTAENNRLFVNAVFWLAKTGAPWRDLPERYGNWNSVFRRFSRWCKNGVWPTVLQLLGSDEDLEELLLDSTIVRAHQHAAGAKGGSRAKLLDAREAGSAQRFMRR